MPLPTTSSLFPSQRPGNCGEPRPRFPSGKNPQLRDRTGFPSWIRSKGSQCRGEGCGGLSPNPSQPQCVTWPVAHLKRAVQEQSGVGSHGLDWGPGLQQEGGEAMM